MSKRYHIVECGKDDNPFIWIVAMVFIAALVYAALRWTWHHIVLHVFHAVIGGLEVGSVALGVAAFIALGLVVTRRIARRQVRNGVPRRVLIPSRRASGLAWQDANATPICGPAEAHKALPEGTIDAHVIAGRVMGELPK